MNSSRTNNNRDQNNGQPRQNRSGHDGKPTKCIVCESIFQYARDCPDNKKPAFQEHSVQYFSKEIEQCFLKQVVSETLNCPLIDTGCSATVGGKNWFQPTKCIVCESIFQYARDCPDNKKTAFQEHSVQYFSKEIEQCFLKQVVSETLNCPLIDTGCSATVGGKNWFQCYVDTLP